MKIRFNKVTYLKKKRSYNDSQLKFFTYLKYDFLHEKSFFCIFFLEKPYRKSLAAQQVLV